MGKSLVSCFFERQCRNSGPLDKYPSRTAKGSRERYSSPSGFGYSPTPKLILCNSQPIICKSVKSFTYVGKTPVHSLSWECCNKTSSVWYPDVLIFAVTGNDFKKSFAWNSGAAALGAPRLWPPCPPHCYATNCHRCKNVGKEFLKRWKKRLRTWRKTFTVCQCEIA